MRGLAFAAFLALLLLAPGALANDWTPELETSVEPLSAASASGLAAAVVQERDPHEMWDMVARLTSDPRTAPRLVGTPQNELSRDVILEWFEAEDGLITARQPFTVETRDAEVPRELENLFAILPGRDRTKWVVMGGHYDTLPTQGAIDNAAGTVSAVHMAQMFSRAAPELEATVVFAAWDGEEIGLYGSEAFVSDQTPVREALGLSNDANVTMLAALSYDIVGLNWPARNPFPSYEGGEYALLNLRTSPAEHHDRTSYGKDRYTEEQLANFTAFQALVKGVAYGWMGLPPQWVKVFDDGYGRSDHVPFINAGIPGMRVQGSHDEEYPYYHTMADNLTVLEATVGKEAILAGWDVTQEFGALLVAQIAEAAAYAPEATPPDGGGAEEDASALGALSLATLALAAHAARCARRRP